MSARHVPRHHPVRSRRARDLWDRKPLRRWSAAGVAVALVAGLASTAAFVAAPATAAATSVSTFTKTAVNQTNGSTANSATGDQGSAKPGDTIKWALNYRNNTGADANVSINDPITGTQTYVPNSLQLPPNWTGSGSPTSVTANGAVLSGATAAQSPTFSAAAVNFTTPGGDGYSVEGFGNSIYTVFHHTSGPTVVFCATLSNQVCPGWPAYSSYVDPTPGTPLGQGTAGVYTSAMVNGSFISNGRLYWPVEQNGAGGVDPFGFQCLDLTGLVSCGYTQFGTTTQPGYAIAGDGIAASNGNRYYIDDNGFMQCVSPTGTSCGAVDVAHGLLGSGGSGELGTYGDYVYAAYTNAANTSSYLTCFNTVTSALCSGFPIATGAVPPVNRGSEVFPVVSSTGTFLGACAIYNSACYSPTGAPLNNPWSQTTYSFGHASNQGFGTGVLVGTRYYTGNDNVVDCYDFAQPLVGGKVQPCAAFTTHPSDLRSYTVRALANLPGCMASNGDGAQISIFNAVTGAPCASASQTVKLTPSAYYCDGQSGHIGSWGTVSLPGLTADEYAGATLTLFGADGTPLPGWQNVSFPASGAQSIDISAIPVTGNTATLTATVNLAAVNNIPAVNASDVKASWNGDPIQVCYETTVDPVACSTTVPLSNTATAVTTAGAITDGPASNSSGTAVFNVTPSAAQCMIQFTKTATPTPAKPGDQVSYKITVHNAGTMDYLAANPASFTDDITDVLGDSAYNAASLTASAGTPSYNAGTNVISWSGPLASNASATVTYTVTVNDPDTGDHEMLNRVVSTDPSNCAANSTDPACAVNVPISDLHVSKSSDPADGSTVTAGQVITYTVTFRNTGKGTAAVDYTDDLSKVVDDATVTSQPTSSNGALTASAVSGGTFTVTGAVPGDTTYTVKYSVTVNPEGQRGDDNLLNFVFPTGTTPPTTCQVGDPLCTEHKAPEIIPSKTSDPASGSTVHAGDVITYTITLQNKGTATGSVDYTDYLAKVLDDATVTSAPSPSNADLTVGGVANDQFTITGTVPAGATYTVTYKVTVKLADARGDSQLDNFVTKTGQQPPATCTPQDTLCTTHLVGHLSITKTASTTDRPAPGDPVSYTVVIKNDGAVDYPAGSPATMTDNLSDVLDDATYNGDVAATAGTPAVSGNTLTWSGPLAVGDSVTITYSVTYNGTGTTIMNTACLPEQGDDVNCDTVSVPAANVQVSKSVSPGDGSTVVAGQVLTYTLTFDNVGAGAGDVDYTDHVAGVLDDADVTKDPAASNAALTASALSGGAFTVTGIVPGNTSYTVSYQVTVKPDGQRGDNVLANFLAKTGTTPPSTCADGDPLCTSNPVPEIVPTKSVDPASGSTVHAGDVLTYTLTFHNIGAATGAIDYTDDLTDVVDDAAVTAQPAASSTELTIGTITRGAFAVTGTVPVGSTYTVTYQVTIKPDGQRGNDLANNFLVPTGTQPPSNCQPDNALCTSNPMPDVADWKTVDPASGTPVVPGQTLTYTLHFTNSGTAPGDVSKMDDITQAVDDAAVAAQPVSSDPALAVSPFGSDHRAAITGTLAAGQTVTITYKLTVSGPDAGDAVLANFLQLPSDPPPTSPECTPADPDHADCTSNPVGVLAVSKSVSPKSGTDVSAGSSLTYTLTFHNTGAGAAKVDYTDHVAKVLDDATVTSAPAASSPALSAADVTDGAFRVTGTLPAGQTVTVTYKVEVKAYADQGDHILDNFLDPTGTNSPSECAATNPLCTHNPVPAPPAAAGGGNGATGGGTAMTGGNWALELLLGALLLGTGGVLLAAGVRRRRRTA